MRGHAGASLEESREMVGAHVHQGAELREPKLPLQILLDVLSHTSESVCWQVPARPIGHADRRGVRLRHALQWFRARLGYLIHESHGVADVASNVVMASPNSFRRNNPAPCTRDFTI